MIGIVVAALLWPAELTMRPFPGLGENGRTVGCMTMTSGGMLFGDSGFGGVSGLALDEEALWMLTDTGLLFRADASFDNAGRLLDLSNMTARKLVDPNRPGKRQDTESLTRFGDNWLVTRERVHDVIVIEAANDSAQITRTIADLSGAEGISGNKGFEAAALAEDGTVVLIAEANDRNHRAPIYLVRDGNPVLAGTFQGTEDHAVTDIAIDEASDRLFILERAFSRARGPRARISVLPLSFVLDADGGVLSPIELGRLGFFDGVDNMEGMDFYRAEDGSDHLILISDDNFNDVQRTVLMTLRLGGTCALAPAQP